MTSYLVIKTTKGILTKIQYLIFPIRREYCFNIRVETNHSAIKEIIEVISYILLKKIDKLGLILKREAKIARQEAGFIISLCVDNT